MAHGHIHATHRHIHCEEIDSVEGRIEAKDKVFSNLRCRCGAPSDGLQDRLRNRIGYGRVLVDGTREHSTAQHTVGTELRHVGYKRRQRKRPQVVELITSMSTVDCLGSVAVGGPREGLFESPKALPVHGLAFAALGRNLLIVALRE